MQGGGYGDDDEDDDEDDEEVAGQYDQDEESDEEEDEDVSCDIGFALELWETVNALSGQAPTIICSAELAMSNDHMPNSTHQHCGCDMIVAHRNFSH